jgi:asparagine synthase (glutamine-hydrolysing)
VSTLFGIWQFDRTSPIEADVLRALSRLDSRPVVSQHQPGLLMIQTVVDATNSKWPFGLDLSRDDQSFCMFDGRIDNRADLLNRFCPDLPSDTSDRELALAVYRVAGDNGFVSIIGDWSLAIWDGKTREMVLASDFAGIRPLYYIREEHRIVCCSSLRLLRDWAGVADVDDRWVLQMLSEGRSRGLTPWRDIYPVPAGHLVRLNPKNVSIQAFWSPPIEDELRYARESEFEDGLRYHFEEAVRVRLRGDSPVCAEVSGGLDSSSVACYAHRLITSHSVEPSRLVTFSYHYEGSRDDGFIARLEDHLHLTGIHLETANHPFAAADKVGDGELMFWQPRLEEVGRRMRTLGSHTLLTGQLGDLIMGNWIDDSEQVADHLSAGAFRDTLRQAFVWARELRLPIYTVLGRAIAATIGSSIPWISSDLRSSAAEKFGDSLVEKKRREALELQRQRRAKNLLRGARPSRRKRIWALNEIRDARGLHCPEPMEQFSVAHPFAHRPLVEFMLKIPPAMVCGPGEPRRLMRRSFSEAVPGFILKRRSKAVYDTVFASSLRSMVRTILEEGVSRMRLVESGYLDSAHVNERLARFLDGLECNDGQLRVLIALEFWMRSQEQRRGDRNWGYHAAWE